MFEIFTHPLLQMAFLAALLASISGGIIGSYVVVRRISFIAGSIAHSILGGMGVCVWLQYHWHWSWASPMLGAFAAALLSALLLGWIQLRFRQREDALIAALWSTGMAIGVIFLSLTPGASGELMDFLFGNILWVTKRDLYALALLDVAIVCLVSFYYRRFLALCFDEEQALLQKIPVQKLYFLLLCLVALSIVLLIQIIGTLLVLTLLTIPATIATLFTMRLSTMMCLSCLIAAGSSWAGLSLSHQLNWPPGATIALVAALAYLLSLLLKGKKIFSQLRR
jgi:zinc transport system permease protein